MRHRCSLSHSSDPCDHGFRAVSSPSRESVRPKFLNPSPDDIRNTDACLIVHGDAARVDELAVAHAGAPPCSQQLSFPVEFLDAITVIPHDVHVVLIIYRDTGLTFGLNGTGARVSR